MKKNFIVAVLCLAVATAFAQVTPQTPDFKNSPMAIKGDGSLMKLEKQNTELKTKAKGMGYGGISTFINITGKNSPVILKPNQEFIVKVDAETDPETVFYMTAAKVVGKSREVEMSHQSAFAMYGAKGKSVKGDEVKLDFVKISDGVYKIKTPGLVSGKEYAFVSAQQGASGSQSTVFCFGVQ